ncbi:MAG: hypothetical protein U0587_02880 [Candidatus Binatia bacterium]
MIPRRGFVVALVLLASLAACDRLPVGYTPVADIVRAPGRYENKQVKVRGEVTDVVKLPFPDVRYYHLRDGDAEIMVFAGETVPGLGDRVSVVGTVNSPAIVGGVGLGLHMTEQRRW